MDPQRPCLANCELFGKRSAFFESAIVPLWQESYDELVARARIAKGFRALDVGTGSGEVAIRLGRIVGSTGGVVAMDSQPEMLQLAKQKAAKRGAQNIEFKQTSMESMDIRADSFDSVVGHYSLCCCTDYKAALGECFRVLKRGGRLTYNHGGPSDPLSFQIMFQIFENYKTEKPSQKLREMRDSEATQFEAVEKYMDPFVTLGAMRGIGFVNPEATLTKRTTRYRDVKEYIDEWLLFDWALETEEIKTAELQRFRKEATEALAPLTKGPGFTIEKDTIFFTGSK